MALLGQGHVKLPPDFNLQGTNAANEWRFWKTSFEDYLIATGQNEANDRVKLSILRNIIGTESARIMSTFAIPEDQLNNYDFTMKTIGEYVNPRVNECFERYNFLKRNQKEGESFEHFLTECKHLVKSCNYNEVDPSQSPEDKALRDKIVMGIRDSTTREALLRIDKLTLEKAIAFCRTSEQSKCQNEQFQQEKTSSVDVIKYTGRKINGGHTRFTGNQKYKKFRHNKEMVRTEEKNGEEEKFKCRRCQSIHGARQCPAFGKSCLKCGMKNHFAVACKVKYVKTCEDEKNYDSDNSLFVSSIKVENVRSNLQENCNNNYKYNIWNETIKIEDKKVRIKVDTGADVSVMPLKVFTKPDKNFKVRHTDFVLKAFEGSKSKPVGVVILLCTHKDNEIYEEFMLIENADQILLGGKASLKLNLVKRVYNVNVKEKEREIFIKENNEIFDGYGKFPGKYKITTVSDFEPVCHPPTKIPLAIRDALKSELDRLVKRKAIKKVEQLDPAASINRIVIVEKTNGKIRLCLDPSDLNKQIVRKPNLMPNIEEIAAKINGKKVFSVFDLSEGYHHLELDNESSWKCCFATPFGTYRFCVLPYGLSNSQDLFQEKVEEFFGNLENIIVCHDDMIVCGNNENEHDEAVKNVIARAKKVGARFNKVKFQYKQHKVKFMGQIFSKDGMEIDPDRVETLVKLEVPKSKEEVQRIIGSFNYIRRYIPAIAEYMHPLCNLLKNNVEFQWLPIHEKSFQTLKQLVSTAPALSSFDKTKKIVLQCDASKNGVGCCMFQTYDNNIKKLVACSSRTMSESELNYSQTEKEMLSIYFATQKFHDFIYRANVDVQTDHKPLVAIMKKPINKIGSTRLQRLRLKLFKYNLNIYYVPGKLLHFADMLSRSSLKVTEHDNEMFEMIHAVSKYLPMSAERKVQFKKEILKDETMQNISRYMLNGWPKEKYICDKLKPFYNIRDDIYIENDFVFVRNKIIVPDSLKKFVLETVHKGHMGISKSIARARQLFFWPHMNTDITTFIKSCRICEKHMPAKPKEPLLPHDIPQLRFNKIGVDILEYGQNSYLVLVDYFSHWIELIKLCSKSSRSVINAMQTVFTRFGYPETLIADNNPFISYECKVYYRKKDISLLTCSPYHHRSNGMAEKAVNIAKNILRKCSEDHSDYREALMEYNNTPIISLKASPAQILQSRRLRSTLPITSSKLELKVKENVFQTLCQLQDKYKQNFDKNTKKYKTEFKEGDKVVIKTEKDKIWQKAVIVRKAIEPRSFWVQRDYDSKILRRNTVQIKPSCTKSDPKMLKPELSPENIINPEERDNVVVNDQNNEIVNPNQDMNNRCTRVRGSVKTKHCNVERSRSGRIIKQIVRLDL